jgi:Uma2 family endonuclease
MATLPKSFLTPEQYLEIESRAEYKSEYFEGQMFAMAGASPRHDSIVLNLILALSPNLRGQGCRMHSGDVRVHIPTTGLFTYPDLSLICAEPQFLATNPETLLNPSLIVEVLSPSTEAYDRGRKFEHYRTIQSLQEYLLVSSERISVDLFTRQPDGSWRLSSATALPDTLHLQTLDADLPIALIYQGIDFSTPPAPPQA